ncbi:MAG: asparaginase [Candidatus Buchananbacteria bacterium]|nr:asparaginase [Candidatus Buchananbacteria bacterium]
MIKTRKKIYLLVASDLPILQKRDWLTSMPELGIIADVEPVVVFNEPSSDITPSIWLKLSDEIAQRFSQADGFVILHDIDNILYTASALSFLLQNLTKPIIITGPYQKRLDGKNPEIRANIINACQAANYSFGEVALMFGNRLLRANQSFLTTEESLNVFNAPPSGILGRIDFSIRIFEKNILTAKTKLQVSKNLNSNIEIININPVLDLKSLNKRLADRDGVVINAGNNQSLPRNLIFLLDKVISDKPVVIWTKQSNQPMIISNNLILVNNMGWESTVLKLMWSLTQADKPKKIKELMFKDLAGETL